MAEDLKVNVRVDGAEKAQADLRGVADGEAKVAASATGAGNAAAAAAPKAGQAAAANKKVAAAAGSASAAASQLGSSLTGLGGTVGQVGGTMAFLAESMTGIGVAIAAVTIIIREAIASWQELKEITDSAREAYEKWEEATAQRQQEATKRMAALARQGAEAVQGAGIPLSSEVDLALEPEVIGRFAATNRLSLEDATRVLTAEVIARARGPIAPEAVGGLARWIAVGEGAGLDEGALAELLSSGFSGGERIEALFKGLSQSTLGEWRRFQAVKGSGMLNPTPIDPRQAEVGVWGYVKALTYDAFMEERDRTVREGRQRIRDVYNGCTNFINLDRAEQGSQVERQNGW
jgi:hypothetical protein